MIPRMEPYTHRERLDTATGRFAQFFAELDGVFMERSDVLVQCALALLAREHVLMTGPPGTGKSALASAIINRIVDEHTGQPSVFARQVTESTVNTDLVGPIDFKTLMQSGRSEHFTDEGMLGAVHAFLDEVLDGRDMLLRSTLNLLQERELKHGQKVTRGRIECALMTTNRYLSDVLQQSRETLLAFVDRISFVNFVPRSFAEPESLARLLHAALGGQGLGSLKCLLTVQDVDTLQEAVAQVEVPQEVSAALAAFLTDFEREVADARRADPRFMPTRYLSTRTAVKLGHVLKAACVYDRATRSPERELVVSHKDFWALRHSLLLCGPTAAQVRVLLERETDPQERRQLEILRREHEIFDACLGRMPVPPPVPAPVPLDLAALDRAVREALEAKSADALLGVGRLLSDAAHSRRQGHRHALALLERVADELTDQALISGLVAGLAPDADPMQVVAQLSELADTLDGTGKRRKLACWLRGRALALIDRALSTAPTSAGYGLTAPVTDALGLDAASKLTEQLLRRTDRLRERREQLLAAGAELDDPAAAGEAWHRAQLRLTDELVPIWDEALRSVLLAPGQPSGGVELGTALDALSPLIEQLERVASRFVRDPARESRLPLEARVLGPRLEPLVQLCFERFDTSDRMHVAAQIDALLARLAAAGVRNTLPAERLLGWAAAAVLRSEPEHPPRPEAFGQDVAGYRALREAEVRVSISFVLLDVAGRLHTSPVDGATPAEPATVLGALPSALIDEIVGKDLARTGRAVSFLERWWKALSEASAGAPELAALQRSEFFQLAYDEHALWRYLVEVAAVERTFAAAAAPASALRMRIESLIEDSRHQLSAAQRRAADARWRALVGGDAS
jgi:MoxR-like ATPase